MINGVQYPIRIGIAEFKRRPSIVGFVDQWRPGPSHRFSSALIKLRFGDTAFHYVVSKKAVRYCTPEETAAYALGWRAQNDQAKLRYPPGYRLRA